MQKMQKSAQQLSVLFQDVYFAWELLNAEIQIEMATLTSGQTIAYLLQLYMRGVEKMNSLADPRQSYFKHKMTSLMTKQTVIRSLKQNPMKKKSKTEQVPIKQVKSDKKQPKSSKRLKNHKQQIAIRQQTPKTQPKQINQLELQQKRRQLQMRMAYVTEQHGPDSLKKLIAQQDNRQLNITNKINKIIHSHEQKLNERIKARKSKTMLFKTCSEITMPSQQPQQLYQNSVAKINQNEKGYESPSKQFRQNVNQFFLSPQMKLITIQQKGKRPKSFQIVKSKEQLANTIKLRKYTFDEKN